jgi:hypothetical protein
VLRVHPNLKITRAECIGRVLILWTGRDPDDQVHRGPHQHVVAPLSEWFPNFEPAALTESHIHKPVDRVGDVVVCHSVRAENTVKTILAVRVVVDPVVGEVGLGVAGWIENVMSATGVFQQDEHRVVPIAEHGHFIDQHQRVVPGTGVGCRETLFHVVLIEGDHRSDLFTLKISDLQEVTFPENERRREVWSHQCRAFRYSTLENLVTGHRRRQSSSTPLPTGENVCHRFSGLRPGDLHTHIDKVYTRPRSI